MAVKTIHLSLALFMCMLFPLAGIAISHEKHIGPYYLAIPDPGTSLRPELAKHVIIDEMVPLDPDQHADQLIVHAYATKASLEYLENAHINYQILPYPDYDAPKIISNYPTFDSLTKKLQQLAQTYPQLLSLESIGKSVQGRDLWFMKVALNSEQQGGYPQNKVQIKLISSMHGNEIVGRELMVYLIEELVSLYGKDPQITQIINNSEIWIMPSMNPDGSFLRQRGNAENIDLNRDFPDISSHEPNSPNGRAKETQLVMNFTNQHDFTLSANFHGGALVVNYPWDYIEDWAPNNTFVQSISREYSQLNLPMYSSREFEHGITNGYRWYPVYGGMQDWSYYFNNCLELTIEVSNNKWPDYSTIPQFWKDNRNSLIKFLEMGQQSFRGIVIDVDTQLPIKANLKIDGVENIVTSNSKSGMFHQLLLPGKYHIKFSQDGYKTYEDDIIIPKGGFNTTIVLKHE